MSELSTATLADQASACWNMGQTGLFLYILDERPVVGGITVLAHLPSPDAAFLLFDSVIADLVGGSSKKRQRQVAA